MRQLILYILFLVSMVFSGYGEVSAASISFTPEDSYTEYASHKKDGLTKVEYDKSQPEAQLENCTNSITIGNNLASKKIGKKGIIKVADRFFKEEDLNKIALVAPAAQINIIRDYQVIEKRKVSLPDIVHGIIRCGNPKCITNNEPMETIFHVTDKIDVQVRCHYCERSVTKEEIEIC